MERNSDIAYRTILFKTGLEGILAEHRLFSSLIERAPYDIVSVVATHQNRPIAFIFGLIEVKKVYHEHNVLREKKVRKSCTSNTLP